MDIRVKICCIQSVSEARMAIDAGAGAVGLVGKMPSGPGPIEDETIFHIASRVPPPVATFLLTSRTRAMEILKHHQRTMTNTIQLVDDVPDDDYAIIKERIPYIKLVQVVHVTDEISVDYACRKSEYADALLLDSGNPNLPVKELGGTGRVHNWQLSRKIVEQVKIPVFLAGGLNPSNVKQAIDEVMPFGVDICSGVRSDGKLDPQKLEAFFNEIY